MARFNAIKIDQLPFPDILTRPDFESLLAEYKAKLPEYIADENARADVAAILNASIEGDLINALLETFAYFIMTKNGEINDNAKALMLPYAYGTTLDVLAYNLYGVSRLVGETDAELRGRAMLAWEALSTAGPYGAYVFHAKSAYAGIKDVAVLGPESGLVSPGQVKVLVLAEAGNGTPPPAMLAAVQAYLNDDDRRPLTDQVIVAGPTIKNYTVQATLRIAAGPGAAISESEARAKVAAYVADRQFIGGLVPISGLYSALTVEGVEQVILAAPTADVASAASEAPYCTGIALTIELVD